MIPIKPLKPRKEKIPWFDDITDSVSRHDAFLIGRQERVQFLPVEYLSSTGALLSETVEHDTGIVRDKLDYAEFLKWQMTKHKSQIRV